MNIRIKTILTVGLAALLTGAQARFTLVAHADAGVAGAQEMMETERMEPIAAPGRLLIKYRDGVSSSRRNSLMRACGARRDREVAGLGVHVVNLADGADGDVYARALKAQPDVEYVEPDYICYPVGEMAPNDPLYSSQWHLPAVSCPMAWGMTQGSDQITIALCDTGVDGSHPDLAPKLVPGWNVVDNNADTSPVASHGTWTAGTAAATGNNAIGVASPALNCRIMPIRVSSLSSGAAMLSDLAAGVVWAADHGARVASVSYMAAASSTMTMIDAGRYIESKGGVLVVASGNTGSYFDVPDTPDIIVVGATDQSDGVTGFSTRGAYVDIAAPGSGILTTAPGNTYQAVNGTSFSTPLVSGAIGLMLSIKPDLTPQQINTLLKVSADDLGPAGWDSGYGWGRLNVGRAIAVIEGMMTGAPDTTPPAEGFLHPVMGGPSNGLLGILPNELIQMNALDESSTPQVTLFLDGALIGMSASAPYAFYCDTSLYVDGSQHTLTAIARDAIGNTTSISTTVTAKAGFDATPPTVSFLQPQDNGRIGISSGETVQVSAADNVGVTAVNLIADGAYVATIASAPYTFTLNTSAFAPGSVHTLCVTAGDQANNWASVSITVTAAGDLDFTPPQVAFVSPKNGERIGGSVRLTVDATDNDRIAHVDFYADSQLVTSWSAGPYTMKWATNRLAKGAHTLECIAYDVSGNTASTRITVTK